MAMPAWIPEAWNRLSADNQRQVGSFMRFLLTQQDEAEARVTAPKRKLGPLSDRFEYIAPDFDAPLEEFEEYM